jgi:hypothetical protein
MVYNVIENKEELKATMIVHLKAFNTANATNYTFEDYDNIVNKPKDINKSEVKEAFQLEGMKITLEMVKRLLTTTDKTLASLVKKNIEHADSRKSKVISSDISRTDHRSLLVLTIGNGTIGLTVLGWGDGGKKLRNQLTCNTAMDDKTFEEIISNWKSSTRPYLTYNEISSTKGTSYEHEITKK